MQAHAHHVPRRLGRALGLAALLLAAAIPALAQDSRDSWQQPDRVVADLGLKSGLRVADIGCGAGYFTFRLAKAVGDSGRVLATDIDPKPLKAIAERARKEHLANIETVQSEPTETRLRPQSVDTALLSDVLHHVPAEQRLPLVKSVVQAIKPGGHLFILDYRKSREVKFDPYEVLIPREDLVKLAADAGLTLDAEFHYLKFQVFLRFRKPE
jgi:ubiquinone/menaquinone biosynthesis C-methylase UbiE